MVIVLFLILKGIPTGWLSELISIMALFGFGL